MENIPTTDIKKIRKLPKPWRKANEIFQIGMLFLSFANAILVVVNSETNNIPTMYFEIYAVVISALPTLWSRMLDEVKVFEEMKTPHTTIDTGVISNETSKTDDYKETNSPTLSTKSSPISPRTSASSEHHARRSKSVSDLNDIHLTQDFIQILESHHIIDRLERTNIHHHES